MARTTRNLGVVTTLAVIALAATACGAGGSEGRAGGDTLLVASTTTTDDTGLLDALIPMFEEQSGYDVTLIVGGSGQMIEQASRGDADVLLTHSPAAEQKMVTDGDGIERERVMYNEFIIVGPEGDPAGVRDAATATDAFAAIARAGARFVSRGDDSGTHVAEQAMWVSARIEPFGASWYSESGQGQGATLQIASQQQAYALTDRGTWLARREDLGLPLLFEHDPVLFNVYHVIVVNPDRHRGVNAAGARAFSEFVRSPAVQNFIRTFGADRYGEPLFAPDAGATR